MSAEVDEINRGPHLYVQNNRSIEDTYAEAEPNTARDDGSTVNKLIEKSYRSGNRKNIAPKAREYVRPRAHRDEYDGRARGLLKGNTQIGALRSNG